jgi:hypothetical protein
VSRPPTTPAPERRRPGWLVLLVLVVLVGGIAAVILTGVR